MPNSRGLVQGLLSHEKPSDLEAIYIPEITRLEDVPQDKRHHPEGNVLIHSLQVLDRAANLKEMIFEEDRLPFMLSAWLHDIGKWDKTFYRRDNNRRLTHWTKKKPNNSRIVAYGHDLRSAEMVQDILERELDQQDYYVISKVITMVANHMKPLLLKSSKLKAFRKLRDREVPLFLVGMLSYADKGEKPEYWFRRIEELNAETGC